ncbi:universal stress protein [Aeromicrobium sp. UC242_57]|uniref:universal stress protein n=1 Tax=Aeromicrobium sp. UC242_57 TaxID=3374624 RepID=UPI0037881502
MTDLRPVLVGVADRQSTILDYAAREAVRAQCALRLVRSYAVPPSPPVAVAGVDIPASYRAGAQDVLDDAVGLVEQGHPGLQVETVLAKGHTPGVLEQESHQARLIVIGPPARKPWYVRCSRARSRTTSSSTPAVLSSWCPTSGTTRLTRGRSWSWSTRSRRHRSRWSSLGRWRRAAEPQLQVVQSEGDAREVALAAAEQAGLLVLTDSFAQKVVGVATCPVAVVPASFRGQDV